jgi:hypothetical protein
MKLVSFFSSKQQMWENELHILNKYICIHILQKSLCSFLIWRSSSSAQLKVLCKVVACIVHYESNWVRLANSCKLFDHQSYQNIELEWCFTHVSPTDRSHIEQLQKMPSSHCGSMQNYIKVAFTKWNAWTAHWNM